MVLEFLNKGGGKLRVAKVSFSFGKYSERLENKAPTEYSTGALMLTLSEDTNSLSPTLYSSMTQQGSEMVSTSDDVLVQPCSPMVYETCDDFKHSIRVKEVPKAPININSPKTKEDMWFNFFKCTKLPLFNPK